MTKISLWRTGVGILLLIFCYRLWNLGITHHDDAVWFLASHQGHWKIIEDFAVSQGRIWAFVSGALLYVSLYFHGTVFGDLLRVGSLAVFFVLFYKVAAVYFGRRLALMAATFNLALYAMRWEGSIATSYPAFSWILGSFFLCAVWLGWRFINTGRRIHLYGALAMFFVSLFLHEGAAVLFAVLFLLSIFTNYYLLQSTSRSVRGFFGAANSRWLMFGALAVTVSYFALYFGWRIAFPSTYEGNALSQLSVERALPVLIGLSTSGSILSDIISPYSVNFSDAVSQDGFRVTYSVLSYIGSSSSGLLAWLYALIVLLVVFSILVTPQNQQEAKPGRIRRKALAGLVVGGLITFLPILPVAFVGKYQQHYYELGVHSYAYTALSHFGVTLATASIAIWFCAFKREDKVFQNAVSGFVAVSIAVLALCGYRMNDAIANDISIETNRWRAVDQAMSLTSLLGTELHAIYAPRLRSGSWFTVVDTNYWSQYVATFHQKTLSFYREELPEMGSGATKIAYMDFMLARDGTQMIVLVAPLARAGGHGEVVADRIAVSVENPNPSDFHQFVLSFKDKIRGTVSVRFSQLEALDKSGAVRALSGVAAVPSSIRFERHSMIQSLPIPCSAPIAVGTKVSFGTLFLDEQQSCNGGPMLRDGWHARERAGVWSKSRRSTITLPTAGLRHGTLVATLTIGTYVGLGFTDGAQQISVLVGGKTLTTRIDKKGIGPQPLRVKISADEWIPGQDLDFILEVDHTINPAGSAISADVRDLGAHLYSLEVESIKELK